MGPVQKSLSDSKAILHHCCGSNALPVTKIKNHSSHIVCSAYTYIYIYITYVLHAAHIYSIYVYTLCIRFVCVFGAGFGFVTVFVMASSCALATGTVLLVAGTCQPNTLGLCQKDLPRICVHQDGKYKEGTYPGWFWEVISEIGLSWVEKRCSRI